jgi:hypothetical protein
MQARMKAGLLLLAVAGMVGVTTGTAEAHHHHRCCGGYYGGCGYGGGCGGGCGGGMAYGGCGGGCGYAGGCSQGGCGAGGCPTGGCGVSTTYMSPGYNNYASAPPANYTSNYAPNAQPMAAYNSGGCGPTTAAYPPSGPMQGAPNGYNGTPYDGGQQTYAPGANNPAQRNMNAPPPEASPPPPENQPPAPSPSSTNTPPANEPAPPKPST